MTSDSINTGQVPLIPVTIPHSVPPTVPAQTSSSSIGGHSVKSGASDDTSSVHLKLPTSVIAQINSNNRNHMILSRSISPEVNEAAIKAQKIIERKQNFLNENIAAKAKDQSKGINAMLLNKYTSTELKPSTYDPMDDFEASPVAPHVNIISSNQNKTLATAIAPIKSAVKKLLRLISFNHNLDTIQVGSNQAVISKKYGTLIDLSPQDYGEIVKEGKKKLGRRGRSTEIEYKRPNFPVKLVRQELKYNEQSDDPNIKYETTRFIFKVPDNIILSPQENAELLQICNNYKNDPKYKDKNEINIIFERPPLKIEVIAQRSFLRIKSLDLLISSEQPFADGGFGTVHNVTNIVTGKQIVEKRARVEEGTSDAEKLKAQDKLHQEAEVQVGIHRKIKSKFRILKKLFSNAFNVRNRCAVIMQPVSAKKEKAFYRMKKKHTLLKSNEALLVDKNKFDKLSDKAKYSLVSTMAAGPAILHAVGVVHRDIKLENYLTDKKTRAILTDFGDSITLKDPRIDSKLSAVEQLDPFEGKSSTEGYVSLPIAKQLLECVYKDMPQREEYNELLKRMDAYATALSIYIALTKTNPTNPLVEEVVFQPQITVTLHTADGEVSITNVTSEGKPLTSDEWGAKFPGLVDKLNQSLSNTPTQEGTTQIILPAVKLMGHDLDSDNAFSSAEWKERVPDDLKDILKGLLEGTTDSNDITRNLQALSIKARELSSAA